MVRFEAAFCCFLYYVRTTSQYTLRSSIANVASFLFISSFYASRSFSADLTALSITSHHAVSNKTDHTHTSFTSYPRFPEALPPRLKHHPIKNSFSVSNSCSNCHADLHVVIYYRAETSCEVRVRRLDKLNWDFDIHIHLQSITEFGMQHKNISVLKKEDLLVIGPSPKSSYLSAIKNTKVKLQAYSEAELYSVQNIPRIIMQTFYTTNASSVHHWDAFHTFIELNPEYEVLLMLDKHCRNFIRKHFPSHVLKAYDTLIPKAFKADLFRYCFLYIRGGCYFDNKMINRVPLRDAILPSDDFLVCSDTLPYGMPAKNLKDTRRFYNAIICSAPKDERMLRTIKQVVKKVNINNHGLTDLSISGPDAFYEATQKYSNESNLRFAHELGRHPYISEWYPKGHDDNNGGRFYRDYFVREKRTDRIIFHKFFEGYKVSSFRRYGDLWNQGKVFYESESYHWKNFQLFVEPGVLPYYTILFRSDGLIVIKERTLWNTYSTSVSKDQSKVLIRKYIMNAGTGGLTDKIELKLVDTENNEEYYLSLDRPSKKNPKVVYDITKTKMKR
jgi:mannosyltransferase OCH1-like enzyme